MYVNYGAPGLGEVLWHEHLALRPLADGCWVIYTADQDMYVETLASPPHEGILWGDLANRRPRLPDGLGMKHKRPVYRFAAYPSSAQVTSLLRQSEELAKREGLATWGDEPGGVRPDPIVVPALAPARVTVIFGDSGFEFGQTIDMEPNDFLRGSYVIGTRGAFKFVGVKVDIAREVSTADLVRRFVGRPVQGAPEGQVADEDETSLEDVRALPVLYENSGERYRTFESAVNLMVEEPFDERDWPLEGPRSAFWWLRSTRRMGITPVGRHSRWVADSGVPAADRSLYEHECLSYAIELACTVDQLNVASLVCFEHLLRRLQLIEEAHILSPSAPSYDGAEHWMGAGRRKGGVLVFPELAKHVATRVREETEVAKERRKAREERRLASSGGKSRGKGGAPDGDDKK